MNINDYTPKHVNLEEAKAKAVSYEGTASELKRLYDEGKVTLVTDESGSVRGIWVNSGTGDLMLDNLSGENFQKAYGSKPVMEWLDKIIRGEELPLTEAERRANLPTEVDISYADLDSIDEDSVAHYLRDEYDHYLSGTADEPFAVEFDHENEIARVTNISWGRKR